MKKRLLSFVVVLMLVLSLVTLIACNDVKPVDPSEESSITFGEGSNGSSDGTTRIKATAKQAFEFYSLNGGTTAQKAQDEVVVESVKGATQNVTVVAADEEGKKFKVLAPFGGYKTGEWYEITVNDGFKFVNYDCNKISFYVPAAAEVTAEYNEDVVLVTADHITNITVDSKDNIWFDYNVAAAGKKVSVGQVLIADSEADQVAYEITSVDVVDGVAKCSAVKPSTDDIYEVLMVTETASLNKDSDVTSLVTEEDVAQLAEIAAAAFDFSAGKAKFNISFDVQETDVVLTITMIIPDLVETESGSYLDLILGFTVNSEIDVLTDVTLGSLINAADKGLDVKADIHNKMTFEARIEDSVEIVKTEALDDILNKIAAMVKDVNENDVTIDLFNWVIPIGNGVASITYNADVVMNFTFAGQLGITSTSSLDFSANVMYTPDTSSPISLDLSKPKFTFDSVAISAQADIHTRIGLYNDLSFDLLGGVLSLGIFAEVGNYNDVYGSIVTTNLLEEVDASYGFYFEGGVYYDVGVKYSVAKLVNGSKSFFDGKQYIPLYDLGHKYQVLNFASQEFRVGPQAQPIVVVGSQKNLVTKEVSMSVIDPAKFSIKTDAQNFVEIKDGKIGLTTKALEAGYVNNYAFVLSADGRDVTCYISLIGSMEVTVADVDAVSISGINDGTVTAAYLSGDAVDVAYDQATGTVEIAKDYLVAGETIIIYVDGVAQKVVYLK